MYAVAVNGNTRQTSSYASAVDAAKNEAARLATAIRHNPRLFRSPKFRAQIARTLEAQKFPKTAGNVSRRVGGLFPINIVKG